MEYDHSQAVADGDNVDFNVYRIDTRITHQGATIAAGEWVGYRDRATRRQRWEQSEDEPCARNSTATQSRRSTSSLRRGR